MCGLFYFNLACVQNSPATIKTDFNFFSTEDFMSKLQKKKKINIPTGPRRSSLLVATVIHLSMKSTNILLISKSRWMGWNTFLTFRINYPIPVAFPQWGQISFGGPLPGVAFQPQEIFVYNLLPRLTTILWRIRGTWSHWLWPEKGSPIHPICYACFMTSVILFTELWMVQSSIDKSEILHPEWPIHSSHLIPLSTSHGVAANYVQLLD